MGFRGRWFLALILGAALSVGVAAAAEVRCLPDIRCGGYDIILVAGQSNATSRGLLQSYDSQPADNDRIWQLGRRSVDHVIVPAVEPLYNVTFATWGIGFALPFARYYRDHVLPPDRRILIIGAAKGSTGVAHPGAYWAPDGEGVADATARLAEVIEAYPDSRLIAVLWHQGESDAASDQVLYRQVLTATLEKIRQSEMIPLMLGEIAYAHLAHAGINASIRAVAANMQNAVAISAAGLATDKDHTHFTAAAQLELGERYFCGYMMLTEPESTIATSSACREAGIQ
jgi:hypothetical protein